MITHCEECNTYFRVSIEQLRAANGQVKCGCCMNVFNALESLIEQADSQEGADQEMDHEPLEEKEQAPHQTSDQGKSSTVAWNNFRFPIPNRGSEPLDAEFTSTSSRATETKSDNEFPPKKEPDLLSEDSDEFDLSTLPVVSHDSIYNTPVKDSSFSTPLWLITSMFLLGLLFFQYFQFNAAADKSSQPVLCSIIDCPETSSATDLSKISLTSRDIREHPQLADVLLVNLTLLNTASVAQAFPKLQLDLFDNSGRAVGSRRFTPSEYLDDSIDPKSMKPAHPIHIVLEIVGTGSAASSFEFTFL